MDGAAGARGIFRDEVPQYVLRDRDGISGTTSTVCPI